MARRRVKRRTHLGANNAPPAANTSASRLPKSMVIRIGAGEVGASVSQLVKDVRSMMEPHTASRLKERRSNRLRDYTTMAGPLGVSHLLLFSRSESGNTNLRLALTPRGPTLHFRVESYSLCKDLRRAMKHPKGGGKEYMAPPLLVMNNFVSPPPAHGETPAVPKHLETLTTAIFQSLFPAISPQTTPLNSIQRVMLINREVRGPKTSPRSSSSDEVGSYTLNLRHYAITTKRTDLPRSIRRINAAERILTESRNRRGLPNLGKLEDVADYLLDPSFSAAAAAGFTSGSESEAETDAEVEVLETTARRVLSGKGAAAGGQRRPGPGSGSGSGSAGRARVERRAVKLVELGPRLRLRMTKVEEGVCGGKVMWHEFQTRSADEVRAMEAVWDARRAEREERKRVQRENVERKKRERTAGGKGAEDRGDDADDDDDDAWDSEDFENDDDADADGDRPMKVPMG